MSKENLKELETELTHSYNMLSIAQKEINDIIDKGNTSNLEKVLSIIIKTNDTILSQLDNVVECNLERTV